MIRLTASEARKDFAGTLKKVRAGDRVLLGNHGKDVGAIVSVADLKLLQRLEDRLDLALARKAILDVEENGSIPRDQVKADLGL